MNLARKVFFFKMTKYVPKKYAQKLKRKMEENEQLFGGEYWSPNNHWTNWIPGQSAFKYGVMSGEGVAYFRGRNTRHNKKRKTSGTISSSKDLTSFMPPVTPRRSRSRTRKDAAGNVAMRGSRSRSAARSGSGGSKTIKTSTGGKIGKKVRFKKYTKAYKRKYKKRSYKKKQYWRTFKIWKSENRGTVSDPNAVYVGCGAPTERVARAMTDAIVFELFKQAGIHITDWTEAVPGAITDTPATIRIDYFANQVSNTLQSFGIDFGTATGTFSGIASSLYTAMVAQFTTFTTHEFVRAVLEYRSNLGAADNRWTQAQIDLKQMKLKWTVSQNMLIQNRTAAGTGTGDDNADDIARNPVYCKYYTRNGNTFQLRRRIKTNNNYVGFQANKTTGIIKAAAADNFDTAQGQEPGDLFLGAKPKGSAIIQPGQIRRLTSTRTQAKTVTGFAHLFRLQFTTAIENMMDVGKSVMICAEHQLKDSGDQNVSLHFELNTTIKFQYIYSPKHAIVQLFENN